MVANQILRDTLLLFKKTVVQLQVEAIAYRWHIYTYIYILKTRFIFLIKFNAYFTSIIVLIHDN